MVNTTVSVTFSLGIRYYLYRTLKKAGARVTAETALVTQARSGDRHALNQLIGLYWQPVYRYIYYKVRHKEEAEELTQETFLKTIAYLPKFEERGLPFRSFLIRVAANLITDYWRKKARSGDVLPLSEAGYLVDGQSPDEFAIIEERRQVINHAIEALPTEQQQVVRLRLIEGRSIKESAEIMQKSEGALKMLQQRALQNIRQRIQGQLG